MEATVNADVRNALEAFALVGRVPQPIAARLNVIAMGAATALTVRAALDDSGLVILALTDNSVITLPAAADATKGMRVRVIAVCADGGAKISLSPAAADGIYGSVAGITGAGAATVVSSGGVDDKDWIMTKATVNKGDFVDLVCDGSTGWYIIGGIGEQASE